MTAMEAAIRAMMAEAEAIRDLAMLDEYHSARTVLLALAVAKTNAAKALDAQLPTLPCPDEPPITYNPKGKTKP